MNQDERIVVTDSRDVPIFLHSKLDDYGLTLWAFRVYAHLCRRAGVNGVAWPTYRSIGRTCFGSSFPTWQDDTLRRRAMEAVRELEEKKLIRVIRRANADGGSAPNIFEITRVSEWLGAEEFEKAQKEVGP
jgi:hypothetical protein